MFTGNGTFPSYLLSFLVSQRDTDHFGKCFMCTNTCAVASDTTDLGMGWEVVSFLSSFSRNRRKPKGREREGVSKAEGEEDMLFTGRTRNL